MRKQTLLILVIIITIISVVYILSEYFGFTRYIMLHVSEPDNYIKNYSKLPKMSKDRVVISFTTTPDRIKKIKPMLLSILDQTTKVDQIAMVIPYRYNGVKYDIPPYVKDIVNVIPSGKNYGKGTSLIPILLREEDCKTIIISVNDDTIYGKDFIETMIGYSEKNPDCVLKNKDGILVKPQCYGCDVIDRNRVTFDMNWFVEKSKKHKTINYKENYKCIM